MADDLEAFLRQAAQRRAARKKPAATPQPAPPPPGSQQPRSQQPVRRPPSVEPQVVEAIVVPEGAGRRDLNVDTSDFERRAEHLGEEVGLADEVLETRLHETFDHKLGALREQGLDPLGELDAAPAEEYATAADIAALIADPVALRNAIVLSEVLARPHHRW